MCCGGFELMKQKSGFVELSKLNPKDLLPGDLNFISSPFWHSQSLFLLLSL